MNLIKESIFIWFESVIFPRRTFNRLKSLPKMLKITSLSIFIFAILYSITALIFFFIEREPAVKPWMPISKDKYYLYQTFFTTLWAFGTWIMMSGFAHLLSIMGKKDINKYKFEDALLVLCIAWIVPSFFLMWIPETTFAILSSFGLISAKIEFHPILEMFRLMIIPPIWQSVLTAIGLKQTHQIGYLRGILIGIFATGLSFIMFLAFMR